VAIIYRDGWGQRGYTAVEKAAIDQRVHAAGLEFLFVVIPPLPTPPTLPTWIPPSFVYCDLKAFSIEAAAACIEQHVRHAGAPPKVETAADAIARMQAERQFAKRREQFHATDAISAAAAEFPTLVKALEHIAAASGGVFKSPAFSRDGIAVSFCAPSHYRNLTLALDRAAYRMDRDAHLCVRLWRDSTGGFNYPPYVNPEYESEYQIDIDESGATGWRPLHSAKHPLLSSEAVADREVKAVIADIRNK
jgi:hypothetical protein